MNGAFSNWLSLKNVSSNKYFSKKTLGIFSQIFLFHDVSVKTTHALFSETMRGLFSFYGVTKLVLIPGEAFYLFCDAYRTFYFEVSNKDQSTFSQNDLNIKGFEMASY